MCTVDIVDVVSKYTTLIETGGLLKGICPHPEHDEKSSSFTVYPDSNSFYCYGCGFGGDVIEFIKGVEELSFREAVDKVTALTGKTEEEILDKTSKESIPTKTKDRITKEQTEELFSRAGYVANGYRGIRDDVNKFFGHLTELDSNGKVKARYYPETEKDAKTKKSVLSGYKCRNHPKDFSYGKIGKTGLSSELSGQVKFNYRHKYCLVTAGEEDKAAAYQMLLDHQNSRSDGDYLPIPVVSPTVGEKSVTKQVAQNLEWFDNFDIIIVGLDNDAVGNEAAIEVAKILPKEKVRIAHWSKKDPNDMLTKGLQKQFIRDFYNAKEFVNSGIKTSNALMDEVHDVLTREGISFPPHMHELQNMMGGKGLLRGRIMNVIGDTSIGKSAHVNGMVYHWIFNAPCKVGIVSLEATAGEYMVDILSLHLEKNLVWMNGHENVSEWLKRDDVQELYQNLLTNEYGEERFVLIDERDGSIKSLEKQIERLVNQYGCGIIVIDVLTDLLRGTDSEKQEDHMKWQKNFVKNGCNIVNVLHTRKPPPNPDGKTRKVTEYDALGSSTFVQSAAVNIVINRDKMNVDEFEKNITEVDMPKCRGGRTGPAGKWYYDSKTRKVYDLNDYLSKSYENIVQDIPESYEQEVLVKEEDQSLSGLADYEEYLKNGG